MDDGLDHIDLVILGVSMYLSMFALFIPLSAAHHDNTIICEMQIYFNEIIGAFIIIFISAIVLFNKYKED